MKNTNLYMTAMFFLFSLMASPLASFAQDGFGNGHAAAFKTSSVCFGDRIKRICGTIDGGAHGRQYIQVNAQDLIYAADGCGAFVIPNQSPINWRSGNEIIFYPGFLAKAANYSLTAYIDPCNNSSNQANTLEEAVHSANNQTLINSANRKFTGEAFSLKVYPNPFKSQTTITFDLPEAMPTSIYIYNTVGKAVHKIQNDFPAGYNELPFENTRNLPAGVYFVRLRAGAFSETKQMVISR